MKLHSQSLTCSQIEMAIQKRDSETHRDTHSQGACMPQPYAVDLNRTVREAWVRIPPWTVFLERPDHLDRQSKLSGDFKAWYSSPCQGPESASYPNHSNEKGQSNQTRHNIRPSLSHLPHTLFRYVFSQAPHIA
jgi:hypothetical protein